MQVMLLALENVPEALVLGDYVFRLGVTVPVYVGEVDRSVAGKRSSWLRRI
jgi:hypothetical protein